MRATEPRRAAMVLVVLGAVIAAGYTWLTDAPAPPAVVPAAAQAAPQAAAEGPPAVPAAIPARVSPLATVAPSLGAKPPAAALPRKHPPVVPPEDTARPTEGKAGAPGAGQAAFTHFRVGNRNVKRIFMDGDRVWVGTSGGVIRYSTANDEFRLYDTRSGLRSNTVAFVGKIQGRIVAGTNGGGMALLDTASGQWENFGPQEGLAGAHVYEVLEAANGDVWIATWSGVQRVRGGALRQRENWELHTVASSAGTLPSDRVNALAEGKNGDIWIGTDSGAAVFRGGAWTRWSNIRGQAEKADFVTAIAADRTGAVWAGTLGGGLGRFDGRNWRSFTTAEGLPGNQVFTLHQDRDRKLWVGTDNGLARMDGDRFRVMTTEDGLFANAVFAMASAPSALWVGGYGGVARIRASP